MHILSRSLLIFSGLYLALASLVARGADYGDSSLSLSIDTLVRISGINDLDFGSYSGNSNVSLDDNLCVWTNSTAGTYKITATGDGTSSAFTIKHGTLSNTIPYTVRWNNTTGTTGNIGLAKGEITANLSGANTTAQDCGGGSNANLQVTMTQSNLLAAKVGTYHGVLTLVISPGT